MVSSMKRVLYLASYDVSDPKRLIKALRILKDYATGGQYSFFECPLLDQERQELLDRMAKVLHKDDSFFLVKLDFRASHHSLGVARPPQDLDFFYLG